MNAAMLMLLSFAAVSPAEYTQANAAYTAQRYNEAVQQYEAIMAQGAADAPLFYNLGNAYFRQGQLAPAIANYERALQLDPRMREAEANLKYALAATSRNLARPLRDRWEESLLFWDDRLRPGEVRWLALACWAGAWAVLLWRAADRRRYQVSAAVLLFLAAGALTASLYAKSYPMPLAVAMQDDLEVRTGANPADTVRYTLKAGDRVRVETEDNGWLRVATVDGERGWAPADAFVQTGPPYLAPPAVPAPDSVPTQGAAP